MGGFADLTWGKGISWENRVEETVKVYEEAGP